MIKDIEKVFYLKGGILMVKVLFFVKCKLFDEIGCLEVLKVFIVMIDGKLIDNIILLV